MRSGDQRAGRSQKVRSRSDRRSVTRPFAPALLTVGGAGYASGAGLMGVTCMTVAKAYLPNDHLREHRLRRGLTLEAAAEALVRVIRQQTGKSVGINAEMIGKYERGERRPGPLYQRAFVLLYGASHEQLGFRPQTSPQD